MVARLFVVYTKNILMYVNVKSPCCKLKLINIVCQLYFCFKKKAELCTGGDSDRSREIRGLLGFNKQKRLDYVICETFYKFNIFALESNGDFPTSFSQFNSNTEKCLIIFHWL